jgi:hypothetical protein
MPNHLDAIIQSIVSRASTAIAKEIVHAVRQSAGANSAPVKRGPGRPRKIVEVAAAAIPEKAPKPKRRKAGKRRAITEAELNTVLSAIRKKPGLTSVQIQKAAGIDSKQAARVMVKLRKIGKVKWKGERSAATYRLT